MSLNAAVTRIGQRVGIVPGHVARLGQAAVRRHRPGTRLHSMIGQVPPVEYETEYYRHNQISTVSALEPMNLTCERPMIRSVGQRAGRGHVVRTACRSARPAHRRPAAPRFGVG
jgi:hypothetical protein